MLYNQCRKCQRPIKYPQKYCDGCQAIGEAYERDNAHASAKRYNKTRDPKYVRFYKSTDWRKLSGAFMQDRSYKCELKGTKCSRLATEVHHIAPIQYPKGWDQRLEWDNLMAVCVQCHNQIHKRFGQ